MSNDPQNSISNPVVLITGGSGFLGQRIVDELFQPDSPIKAKEVRVFDIQSYSGQHPSAITFIEGDVTDYAAVQKACAGVDIVFHAAAIIDWGVKEDAEVLGINVGGTENVIKACLANKVGSLVYTGSLDAVYTGKPLRDIDESQGYPKSFKTTYCRSKYLGEKLTLEANCEALRTVVLRPSDIYGEADPYHIDPLIDMAKSGFYIRLGNGKSLCQHVYVGNMAVAELLAGKALLEGNNSVCGKPYFITDGKGSNFFCFFDRILEDAGYELKPKDLWLPEWLAYPMAALTEFGAWLISPIHRAEVKFSRFAVAYTCHDFTFTSQRAERDFGFKPKYSTEEAVKQTAAFYRMTVER